MPCRTVCERLVNLDGLPSKNNWPDVSEHERTRMLHTELTGLARSSPPMCRGGPSVGHLRRVGRASAADEPPAVTRMVALSRERGRSPRSGRLALEDRSDPSLRRVRPVASGVVDAAHARSARTGPRCARARGRGHGLGYAARGRGDVPAAHRAARGVGGCRALRAHRTARRSSRRWCSTSSRSSCESNHRTAPQPRVLLALHELRSGEGRPLLLLHGLGERTPDRVPAYVEAWDGPVFGLDFTGHGAFDETDRWWATRPRS